MVVVVVVGGGWCSAVQRSAQEACEGEARMRRVCPRCRQLEEVAGSMPCWPCWMSVLSPLPARRPPLAAQLQQAAGEAHARRRRGQDV